VRGEAASDAGLFIGAGRRWRGREPRTRSSCLPVNGGSGSSAGGIRDEESTRHDGGAVGQDPTGSDAMESKPGQRQARGGRRLAAATHWWPAVAFLRGLARVERVTAHGDGMARRARRDSRYAAGREALRATVAFGLCCCVCRLLVSVHGVAKDLCCKLACILDGEVCLACELDCCCCIYVYLACTCLRTVYAVCVPS
jgi:hypothetical protein